MKHRPKTRILATLGPASANPATLRRMFRAGLDAVRFNFSHGDIAGHRRMAALVTRMNRLCGRRVETLQDLKGNRIRVGELKAPAAVKKGDKVTLTKGPSRPAALAFHFDYEGPLAPVKKGHRVFIDDGRLVLRVEKTGREALSCRAETAWTLKSRKGVNIPDARLDFPLLSAEDAGDIKAGAPLGFDWVAQSFVRSAADIKAVKKALSAAGSRSKVIAKLESREALENLDSIIKEADGVMVARGDLGINLPIWQVPLVQKVVIRKCRAARKPVITATQMLESMTENLTPTRAEVSDVANAVLDGTDYVMLSGETASGKYPAEAVAMMNEVIRFAERPCWPY